MRFQSYKLSKRFPAFEACIVVVHEPEQGFFYEESVESMHFMPQLTGHQLLIRGTAAAIVRTLCITSPFRTSRPESSISCRACLYALVARGDLASGEIACGSGSTV